jgi:hypothetical protein
METEMSNAEQERRHRHRREAIALNGVEYSYLRELAVQLGRGGAGPAWASALIRS